MISIQITGVQHVQRMLAKWQGVNRLVESWMKSGKPDEIMQKSFLQNFRYQGRPRWQDLSEETIASREYDGYDEGPILQRSGELMDGVTKLEGKVISSLNYSQMTWGIDGLDSGAKKKFGPNQMGKGKSGQKLPARPMIGFQAADGKTLATSLGEWIAKQIA